jgi:hypothetical protein
MMISKLPLPYSDFKLDSALKLSGSSPVKAFNERSLEKNRRLNLRYIVALLEKDGMFL